jgi:hypothetical protein
MIIGPSWLKSDNFAYSPFNILILAVGILLSLSARPTKKDRKTNEERIYFFIINVKIKIIILKNYYKIISNLNITLFPVNK